MIKFAALNATEENTSDAPRKNKEVLESDAFQKYNKALALIKNKDNEHAEVCLKELLLHPYFNFDDESFPASDFFNDPAVKLLTSIYKNLGKVHENMNNYDDALERYLEAVSSDKSDITTWYNIANVAIKKANYTLACDSLKECLNINPSFWPSIDTLICLLYALGDYLSCLHLIQHSLSLNKSFQRALCVKAQIEEEDPLLFNNFAWKNGFADLQPEESAAKKEMIYPKELREKDQQAKKASSPIKTDPILYLREISSVNPLADLGMAITELFVRGKEEDLSLFCPVDFTKSNLNDLLNETDDKHLPLGANDKEEGKVPDVVSEDTTKEGSETPKLDSPSEDHVKKLGVESQQDQEVKDFLRREGYRRSKRVKDMQLGDNDSTESLQSQLESWIPNLLKDIADIGISKSLVPRDERNEACTLRMLSEISEVEVLKQIVDDTTISLVPLMKKYCNILSAQYCMKWPKPIIKAFLNVYFSYREYEALPNILQNFREQDTEENVLTLLCVFEIIVNHNLYPGGILDDKYFADVADFITKASLDKDQEFLRIANGHDKVKESFSNASMYDSFQLRYAWAYCLYEEKLGNIECSLEFVKLCMTKITDCSVEDIVIANSFIPVVNVASLELQKGRLVEIQERENVASLFKEKNYTRVVEVLRPMLDDAHHDLDMDDGQIPTRHKNLLILLESLRKVSKMDDCLKCGEMLLRELVPFLRFTDTFKSLLTKIFKYLAVSIAECSSNHINESAIFSRIIINVIKIVVTYFDKCGKEATSGQLLADFPIERALIVYHMIIDRAIPASDESEQMNVNVSRIQSLTLCHELLGGNYICSAANGVFLMYVIDCCNRYKSENVFMEDTTNLFEQAVYCYLGHPGPNSKRSKKNRVDHAATNVKLTKEIAIKLYTFYEMIELFNPMEKSKHISSDTFDLFANIIQLVNIDVTQTPAFLKIKEGMEKGTIESTEKLERADELTPYKDIFYLCGDYLWKYEEYNQAIDWFVCDLTLNPDRIKSWLSIGLCWLSIAEDRFNHAKSDLKVVIESIAPKTILCMDHFMSHSETDFDVVSEYSSFLYTIASVYNQVAGALSENKAVLKEIDSKRVAYISKAKQVLTAGKEPDKPKRWAKSFMLGKMSEKLNPDDKAWLDYYMEGFKDLDDYTQTLTKKINSSAPTDYSIECLELSFRVAYSIYKWSIIHPNGDKEDMLSQLKLILEMMGIFIQYENKSLAQVAVIVLEECLTKFPEHYKVRNALCKIIHESSAMTTEDCTRAKSLMLQETTNTSGMFLFTRKHLFLGIWRIPVDIVDRPGGFFRHMRKSLSLLIASLTHCQDINNLVKLFETMMRTAEQLNNFVGDVSPFLQTTLTQIDALLRSTVSEHCNQKSNHSVQNNVKLLTLSMRVKNIHVKSNIDTKPVDEAILVLLKLFKLNVPQQLEICDPNVLKDPGRLYEIARKVTTEMDLAQQVTAQQDVEQNKKAASEPTAHSAESSIATATEEPDVVEVRSKDPPPINTDKIVVNDNAKSAVRQAVAQFISQMADKNQGKNSANVSQILSIINNSIKGNKENSSTKIREILLKAVNKKAPEKTPASPAVSNAPVLSSKPDHVPPISNVSSASKLLRISPSSLKSTIPRLQKTINILQSNNKGLLSSATTPTLPKTTQLEVSESVKNPNTSDNPAPIALSKIATPSSVASDSADNKDKVPAKENKDTVKHSQSVPSPLVTETAKVGSQLVPSKSIAEEENCRAPAPATTSDSISQKRKYSTSPSPSCSDGSDDEMPSLDDMPSLDTVPTPQPSQFRNMPSLAHRDEGSFTNNSVPIMTPPQLIKKEMSGPYTAPHLHSPPPMYCRSVNKSPGGSRPSPQSLPKQFLLQQGDGSKQPALVAPNDMKVTLTPEQVMALNIANPKRPKSIKPPKPKKERLPRKKKLKEEGPKKKREKKRKIDNTGALKQFDFPYVEKTVPETTTGGNSNVPFRRGISEQPASHEPTSQYFRQSSEPNLQHMPHYSGPLINQANPEERLYKAEDFFADGSAAQRQKPNFLSGLPFSQTPEIIPSVGAVTPDASMFSPASSENLSSENVLNDELENVDLGILNELDACDLTEERERLKAVVPAKPKRGRKPKDPNKPKAPSKRKKKKIDTDKNGMFGGLPHTTAQFLSPSSQFQYTSPEPGFPTSSPPAKHYYYPGDPMLAQSSTAPKLGLMQGSMQPHTVQQATQLGLAPCSSLQSPPVNVPCQYQPPTSSPTTQLSHFSPPQPDPSTYPLPTPAPGFSLQTAPFDPVYSSTNTVVVKQEGLKPENEAEQAGGYVMQQYPGQQFGGEMFPTSLYPESPYPPTAGGTSPPAPHTNSSNTFKQYQKFRNF